MAEKNKRRKFKNDRYSKSRGGKSIFLNLTCTTCNRAIALYQKDGPGSLLRLYLDRIVEPPELSVLQSKVTVKSEMTNLTCPGCSTVLGTPMVYEPETRLAYRLIPGKLAKNLNDGNSP